MNVRLLRVPGCPRAPEVRALLDQCLRELGLTVLVEEVTGAHPSPTLLVDGLDVVTGRTPGVGASCRLDLPTPAQVRAALRPDVAP